MVEIGNQVSQKNAVIENNQKFNQFKILLEKTIRKTINNGFETKIEMENGQSF